MTPRRRTVKITVEATLHEPQTEDGVTSYPVFLLFEGGDYTIDATGETYGCGYHGSGLAVYLPGHRAITLSIKELIDAGLALEEEHTNGTRD